MGASRHFPVVVVVLAGMALSLSCVVPAPAIAESPQIGKARKLVGDGKSYEAIQSLKKASQDARGQPLAELLNAQGWLLYREGRGDQAEEVYLRALAEAEKSGDRNLVLKIKNNLGINYYVSGRLDDAEKAFSEGAGMNSALSTKYLALIREQKTNSQLNQHIRDGIGYRLNGEFEKAVAAYTKALAIDSSNVRALEYRGYAYLRAGQVPEARADLEKAFRIEPARITTSINLLKVYCLEKSPDAYGDFVAANRSLLEERRDVLARDAELQRYCGHRLSALGLRAK